jgi:methionyl-tRNA formyltransferase
MGTFKTNRDVKILYMGTPEMSAHVLSGLIEAGFSIIGLVCQEDKEVGRKKTLEPPPTKVVALAHGIPVFQPHKIRLDFEFAKALDFDLIVTMAYGQIIPQGLLDLPKVGCLNLHGSLLPKYRGAAPIQRAIMAGEKETGITLMRMVAAMDAGEMFDKEKVTIEPNDTYTLLCSKMAEAAKVVILRDALKFANGELPGEPQDEKEVTIANKIKPEDEHLPLFLPVEQAVNYVRGLSEAPGAYLLLEDKKLKIYHAHVANHNLIRAVGEVIPDSKHLLIQFYDGEMEVDVLQLEGKKKMDAASFLLGAHLSTHCILK